MGASASAILTAGVAGLVACGGGASPPPATAQTTCTAQVQDCVGGIATDGTCLQYGSAHSLSATPGGNDFDTACPGSSDCPDPNAAAECLAQAQALCTPPQCQLDPTSIMAVGCAKTCESVIVGGGGGTGGGGGGGGSGGSGSNTAAPYQILSFEFTFADGSIGQTPMFTTPIPAALGTPLGIAPAGFLDVLTSTPNKLIAFDLSQNMNPPPQVFALDLPVASNSFVVANFFSLIADTGMADVQGLSLYSTRNAILTTKKTIALGGSTSSMALDPNVANSEAAACLTPGTTPPSATVLTLDSTLATPAPFALSGTPKGLTMDSSDAWVLDTSAAGSVITRLVVPSPPAGTSSIGSEPIPDTPISIGGGAAQQGSSPAPGAVVVLATTASGEGEFEEFFGGAVDTPPTVIPLTSYPPAIPVGSTPKKASVLTIGGIQYAWVVLLEGTDNVVALFDLANKTHVDSFDVHLGILEPVAVSIGLASGAKPANDAIAVSQTAFVHVLVKAN